MGRSLPSSDLDPRCSSQAFATRVARAALSPFPLWRPDSDCAALSLLQRLVWTRPPSRVPKLRCHQGCQQRTGPPALSSSSNEGTAISKPRFLYRYIMYTVTKEGFWHEEIDNFRHTGSITEILTESSMPTRELYPFFHFRPAAARRQIHQRFFQVPQHPPSSVFLRSYSEDFPRLGTVRVVTFLQFHLTDLSTSVSAL